ncbi:hypothetical protein GCM10011579_059950 [Streptomyces albiflavescens]|uniref:SpdC protein n=1 Tax=Streptomyces albiflavescens TaxID=1623582 RepID=A0A917Y9G1_9ACTN|nr:hypothetical protein [Streptomyces albiflavescens]GGN77566.1 hypothetical protein GCM10011579_059950 [Streptomyces albiflavescens]
MTVPLWLFIACIGWVGIKLVRPPLWLVIVLLLGGYLLADSFLAPAIDTTTK